MNSESSPWIKKKQHNPTMLHSRRQTMSIILRQPGGKSAAPLSVSCRWTLPIPWPTDSLRHRQTATCNETNQAEFWLQEPLSTSVPKFWRTAPSHLPWISGLWVASSIKWCPACPHSGRSKYRWGAFKILHSPGSTVSLPWNVEETSTSSID